jgi:hypothetical protein
VFFTDVCLKKYVLIPSLLSSARAGGGDWGGGGEVGKAYINNKKKYLDAEQSSHIQLYLYYCTTECSNAKPLTTASFTI